MHLADSVSKQRAARLDYRREYLVRLPLPLAQLYVRAFNAKDARGRHDNCFYLFECLIKVAACPAIAAYLSEVRNGARRDETLDGMLTQIALPSLGQWLGFLRETSRYFAERDDASVHPLGSLGKQLTVQRQNLIGVLALYRRIRNGPDGDPSDDQSVSLLELFDSLLQYRTVVFNHGTSSIDGFYEEELGPLLFPAVNDVLGPGVLDLCGPGDSRLVFVRDVRRVTRDSFEVDGNALIGLKSERLEPIRVEATHAEELIPERIFLFWEGTSIPLSLDPLMVYRNYGVNEEVLLLSRDRDARKIEYLSYTTGQTERNREMIDAVREMLSTVTGTGVSREALKDMADQTRAAEMPGVDVDDLSSDESAGVRIGDFEILAELGRGGMGVVYLARQLALGRTVALKMLPSATAADETARARFKREINALAQCEHPGIVRILFSGQTPTGQPYYAMEYVPGATLDQTFNELSGDATTSDVSSLNSTVWTTALLTASRKNRDEAWERVFAADSIMQDETQHDGLDTADSLTLDGSRLSLTQFNVPRVPELVDIEEIEKDYPRRVAMIIRDAACAAAVMHEHGIVHRDIKPSNLVLSPDGKRVILMDFGLVKGEALTGITKSGAGFLGTLRYAAPEQLASASIDVGAPADVRGLGVTLWELLTRRRLFDDAQDETQLAQAVIERDVPLLRTVDSGFNPDLEAIVARATERSASKRIQTAGELAGFLDDYLERRSVGLRVPGIIERSKRRLVQNRLKVALVAVCVLAFGAVLTALWESEQISEMQNQQILEFSPPRGLQAVPVPSDNMLTVARVELGRRLFFDKRLSGNDRVACVTCHQPSMGYAATHGAIESVVAGYSVSRDSQSVMNVSYHNLLFRDGRVTRLELHALHPILNPAEMGMSSREALEEKLREIPAYRTAFQDAFGSEINADDVARAIAAFERTLVAGDSPYDRFVEGDQSAMSEEARRGLDVFHRCHCGECHKPPLFGHDGFFNVGIGFGKQERDFGRQAVTRDPDDQFAFRSPILRDLNRTAPYMHDGSLKTLEEVVDYLDQGGSDDPDKDYPSEPLDLTDGEKKDLVAFLRDGLASGRYPMIEPPDADE